MISQFKNIKNITVLVDTLGKVSEKIKILQEKEKKLKEYILSLGLSSIAGKEYILQISDVVQVSYNIEKILNEIPLNELKTILGVLNTRVKDKEKYKKYIETEKIQKRISIRKK